VQSAGLDEVRIMPADGAAAAGTVSLGTWLEDMIRKFGTIDLETLGLVGLAAMIYAAVAMMVTIEDCFNTIYRAPQGRSWLRRMPVYWTVLTVGPIGIALLFVVDSHVGRWIASVEARAGLIHVLGVVWSISIITLMLLGTFVLLPNTQVSWRSAIGGAFVSAVLLHMVSELADGTAKVPVIWVDTGYLPPETYRYAETLQSQLGFDLRVVQATISPARMEALHGRLWETGRLEDLELYNRLRKVEPLDRAFHDLGVACWASGVRGGQTDHRRSMAPLEAVRGRWSLRPLLAWSKRDVFYYMQHHGLPQHPLFDQGYSTVGDWHTSAPDDASSSGRATRFGGLKQECGIHLPGVMGEGI
jgi:phosphoadenosine phosphosulfate reductase